MSEIVLQLDEHQKQRLEEQAQASGMSEQEVLLAAFEQFLDERQQRSEAEQEQRRAERAKAWAEARAFMDEWVSRPDRQATKPWSREELYEEMLKERLPQFYGRPDPD